MDTRLIKLKYLQHAVETVSILNAKGEYEIKPTKNCEVGDIVWILKEDNDFVKTQIF